MRTPILIATLLTAFFTASLLGSTQERDSQGFSPASQGAKLLTDIQGGWQLIDLDHRSMQFEPGSLRGYMVVTEGFMSLEFHAVTTDLGNNDVVFQTGIYELGWTSNNKLQAKGLIGTHNTTFEGESEFERPGRSREFKTTFLGEQLVLERADDGTKLTFRRLKINLARDFFGREVKPAGSTDSTGTSGKR